MSNFSRHLYVGKARRDAAPIACLARAVNAYTAQMAVAGVFAAIGFTLFMMASEYGTGLLYWFAGIVFGAHFSDKAHDWIRSRGA